MCSVFNRYDPSILHEIVHEKHYPEHDIILTVRPVCVDSDIAMISQWIVHHYKAGCYAGSMDMHHLKESYASMLEVDNAQALLGLCNGEPSFQVSIFPARWVQEIRHVFTSDVFMISLVTSPVNGQTIWLYYRMLETCLEHFFQSNRVGAVVVQVEDAGNPLRISFDLAGFTVRTPLNSSQPACLFGRQGRLYGCSREQFYKRPGL